MSEKDFVYWLQGFVEIGGGKMPDEVQWKIIKDHLSLLFNKQTPAYPPFPVGDGGTISPTSPASDNSHWTLCNDTLQDIVGFSERGDFQYKGPDVSYMDHIGSC